MRFRIFWIYFSVPIIVILILSVSLLRLGNSSSHPAKNKSLITDQMKSNRSENKTATIKGQVTDENGEPLSQYLVEAISAEGKIAYSARPDISGRFEFSKLDKGLWIISVKFAEMELDRTEIRIAKGMTRNINFSIPTTGAVSGVLVDATHQKRLYINGRIELGCVSGFRHRPDRIFAGSISEGKFEVTNLPPGNYAAMNSISGYALNRDNRSMITVNPGQHVTDLKVQLEKGAVVHGRLVDIASQPLPNLEVRDVVRTYSIRSSVRYGRIVMTDDNGEFSMMIPCEPERYRLFYILIDNPGYQGQRIDEKIEPEQDRYELGDIVVEKTLELRGKISPRVAGREIDVILKAHDRRPVPPPIRFQNRKTAHVDTEGNFAISELYPIEYSLTVIEDRTVKYFLKNVNPKESPYLKIFLQKTQIIKGRVTDAYHNPLSGADVVAGMIKPGERPMTISQGTTQADGTFQLEVLKLKPQYLTLSVFKEGYLSQRVKRARLKNKEKLRFVLEHKRSASIRGYVFMPPDISQDDDFKVKLFPSNMSMEQGIDSFFETRKPLVSRRFKRTNGSFSIEGLSGAKYRLYVVGDGLRASGITVDLISGDKEINLFVKPSSAHLHGQVLWADSKEPIREALVRRSWYPWELEPYDLTASFRRFEVSTDEQGRFEFKNVMEGNRYTLQIGCMDVEKNPASSGKKLISKRIDVFASKDADYIIYVGRGD